jgi:hypothetical protein
MMRLSRLLIPNPRHRPATRLTRHFPAGSSAENQAYKVPELLIIFFLSTLLPSDCVMDRLSFSAPEAWFVIRIR